MSPYRKAAALSFSLALCVAASLRRRLQPRRPAFLRDDARCDVLL